MRSAAVYFQSESDFWKLHDEIFETSEAGEAFGPTCNRPRRVRIMQLAVRCIGERPVGSTGIRTLAYSPLLRPPIVATSISEVEILADPCG